MIHNARRCNYIGRRSILGKKYADPLRSIQRIGKRQFYIRRPAIDGKLDGKCARHQRIDKLRPRART